MCKSTANSEIQGTVGGRVCQLFKTILFQLVAVRSRYTSPIRRCVMLKF